MPHTKSVSVLFLPKSPSPLIEWVNDTDLQIRHSQSDPVIHTSKCRLYIDSAESQLIPFNRLRQEESSELSDTDTFTDTLLHSHLYPSSPSTNSMESTISCEDLINDMITIEGLRIYNSCFSCGVCWYKHHVTLDCSECGGYAMERPCPDCDGKCDTMWRRNLTLTHDKRKAFWDGECKTISCVQSLSVNDATNKLSSSNNHQHTPLIATLQV